MGFQQSFRATERKHTTLFLEGFFMGELEDIFEKRWRTLERRSVKEGLQLPRKTEVYNLFLRSWEAGFKCDYCKHQLHLKDVYPYYFVWSLEHKHSIHLGGDNHIENLSVICHRCNICKGPMSEQTWRSIIRYLPPDIFDKMCNESFAAGMSRELKRQGLSNNEDTSVE